MIRSDESKYLIKLKHRNKLCELMCDNESIIPLCWEEANSSGSLQTIVN
jgi:hypothetical protein